jgi:hypothetical protein
MRTIDLGSRRGPSRRIAERSLKLFSLEPAHNSRPWERKTAPPSAARARRGYRLGAFALHRRTECDGYPAEANPIRPIRLIRLFFRTRTRSTYAFRRPACGDYPTARSPHRAVESRPSCRAPGRPVPAETRPAPPDRRGPARKRADSPREYSRANPRVVHAP